MKTKVYLPDENAHVEAKIRSISDIQKLSTIFNGFNHDN